MSIRPVDDREGCGAPLVLAKAAGRSLPVAANGFARQLAGRIAAMADGATQPST